MVEKVNRKCIICGTEYSYCVTCGKDRMRPSWMTLFCGDTCHDTYEICTQFRDGVITAVQAQKKLEKCDLTEIEEMNEGFQKLITQIQQESKLGASDAEVFEKAKAATQEVAETQVEKVDELNSVASAVETKESVSEKTVVEETATATETITTTNNKVNTNKSKKKTGYKNTAKNTQSVSK